MIAAPAAGLSPPLESIAIEAGGATALLVEEGSGELSRVDVFTGAVTTIASGIPGAEAVAIEAGGATALVVEEFTRNLIRVNLSNGAKTVVASGIDSEPELEEALEIEEGGNTVLLTNERTGRILRVDLTMGTSSVVASGLAGIEGLALEAGGTTALAALNSSHTFRADDRLVRVSLTSGLVTSVIAQTPNLSCPQVPKIESGGRSVLLTESCPGRLSRVNLTSGATTTIATGFSNAEGLAIEGKLPPIVLSNILCLAAVEDLDGGGIVGNGSGDEDGDGLTDLEEACELGTDPCEPDGDGGAAALTQFVQFIRGDANADQELDISDAISTLAFLFLGRSAGSCLDAQDANDDGGIDVSDPVYVFGYLFVGGAAPPAPYPDPGPDPTEDLLEECKQPF